MFVRCTNPSYPCGEGDHNCIDASSFFVPQAVMTYANVDYDPTNATTLINSLDLLWVKSNQCNRASPWFWLVRDCSDLMLVLGITRTMRKVITVITLGMRRDGDERPSAGT